MAWEWVTKKCGYNFATSNDLPSSVYAWSTIPVSDVSRGNSPISINNIGTPFNRAWVLDYKIVLTFKQTGANYEIEAFDWENNTRLARSTGTNNISTPSIDIMFGIEYEVHSAFPIFLVTDASNTSNFKVLSLLMTLTDAGRLRCYNVVSALPENAPTDIWDWATLKSGYNLATSSLLPENAYQSSVIFNSEITRGNTPISENNVSVPFNKSWTIQDKLQLSISQTGSTYTAVAKDLENNSNMATVSGTNNLTPTDIDILIGVNDTGNLAFPIFLLRDANYSSRFLGISLLDALLNTDKLGRFYELFNSAIISNGGGATHIAKVTGQLKDLSSNLSDILMVSGGGGGGLLVGDTDYSGKEAGGISGSGDNSADQTTGNAFGLGESGTDVSGGGSGLYGGYKGTSSKSGGAGSGYIGNSLVNNKKMVGYNVPTSDAEGTKTESVNNVSASAVSGKPKSGNGFARIKFLRNNDWRCLESIEVDGVDCPLLQINDFSIIPNAYGGSETLIRRQSGMYIPSGVSDLGSEFAQPTISSGTVEKSTNYNNVIFRTTFGYNASAYSNFNQNDIIYNANTALMRHGFLLATEANTRLYIGIALNDAERYGCCYFVAQYPDRNWTTENYSGGDGEIGRLIYSIFGNS